MGSADVASYHFFWKIDYQIETQKSTSGKEHLEVVPIARTESSSWILTGFGVAEFFNFHSTWTPEGRRRRGRLTTGEQLRRREKELEGKFGFYFQVLPFTLSN